MDDGRWNLDVREFIFWSVKKIKLPRQVSAVMLPILFTELIWEWFWMFKSGTCLFGCIPKIKGCISNRKSFSFPLCICFIKAISFCLWDLEMPFFTKNASQDLLSSVQEVNSCLYCYLVTSHTLLLFLTSFLKVSVSLLFLFTVGRSRKWNMWN